MDEEEAAERVKGRIEQAERAVEKFVARRLKAVQPGLQKVGCLPRCSFASIWQLRL